MTVALPASAFDIDADAADTLRLGRPVLDDDVPSDPDATSIYDLRPAAPSPRGRSAARRRLIRSILRDIAGLRDAITAGWDVGPELAHEERRLAALETA